MGGYVDTAGEVARMFELGRQHKMADEETRQRQEDRKLARELHQFQIKRLQLADKMEARQAALGQAQLMETQPGRVKTEAADLGMGQAPAPVEMPQGVPEGAPQTVKDLLNNRKMEVAGVANPAQIERTTQPHEPVTLPPVEEYGLPATTIQPRTREEVQAQGLADLLRQLRIKKLGDMETVVLPGGKTVQLPSKAVAPTIAGEYGKERAQITANATTSRVEEQQKGASERAKIRAGATTEAAATRTASQEKIAEENRRQAATIAANRLLASENTKRAKDGLPALTSPPGSEIGQLERTDTGPGTRRWGHGNKMPTWLAQQYLQQAKGDVNEARRMADADGWQRF